LSAVGSGSVRADCLFDWLELNGIDCLLQRRRGELAGRGVGCSGGGLCGGGEDSGRLRRQGCGRGGSRCSAKVVSRGGKEPKEGSGLGRLLGTLLGKQFLSYTVCSCLRRSASLCADRGFGRGGTRLGCAPEQFSNGGVSLRFCQLQRRIAALVAQLGAGAPL